MNQIENNWATKIGNKNPRILGFIIILLSLILVVINYVSLKISNFYYPEVYLITPIIFLVGLWIIITGQLHKSQKGSAPLWWQIGLYSFVAVGIAIAVYIHSLGDDFFN